MKMFFNCLAIVLCESVRAAAVAGEIAVLHYWTSGGEAAAADQLKQSMIAEGHHWKDLAVAGGGGETAMTVLKSLAVSENLPAAAQLKGADIQTWGELGFLSNFDTVAKAHHWDVLFPEVVKNAMRYNGHYVAVPVNVHRVNWMWVNPQAFRKAGATIPTTWQELLLQGPKFRAVGITPLAHGGQPWQDATLFESVALGLGGSEFYRRAFVDHDDATLRSEMMVDIFRQFKQLNSLMDIDRNGQSWNQATASVINGTAAMQIMGDWAKGEFTAAGKTPGIDYLCMPAPQTSGAFSFDIDSLAMFNIKGKERIAAQKDLARLIVQPEFQEAFNLAKGSIPARLGVSRMRFDSCSQDALTAFNASVASASLVPSFSHGMASSSRVQDAIVDVISNYFDSDKQSAVDAVARLAKTVKASR